VKVGRDARLSFGPSWIALLTEMDTASIITGLQAGALHGCVMALLALALTAPLFFVHEVAGSLGPASGMGIGGAVRKLYGRRSATTLTYISLMAMSDVVGYIAQYSGIALALQLLGLPTILDFLIALPVTVAMAHRSGSWRVRAMLLALSIFLVGAVMASAFMSHPVTTCMGDMRMPHIDASFYYMTAALVGATISPWSVAFHSGARRLRVESRALRLEVLAGALASQLIVAVAIMDGAAGGGASPSGIQDLLRPLGNAARYLLGAAFIGGSLLAISAIALTSSWRVLGAGAKRGALAFELVPIVEGTVAASVVALVHDPLALLVGSMVAVTLILLPQLYVLGRVASEEMMGSYRLRGPRALAYWISAAFVALSGALAVIMTVA